MSDIPTAPDVLGSDVAVLALPDVARRLGLPVTRVHQMLRDSQLVAVRRDGVVSVPADFLAGGVPDVAVPDVAVPDVAVPDVAVPDVAVPDVAVPDVAVPDVVVKGLPGTLTVLHDAGFADAEILRWLFTADDSLPGTPIGALRADRGHEVKRRAQAMAF